MTAVRRRLPKSLRSTARAVVETAPLVRLASGPASLRQLYRLERSTTHWGPGERTVAVRLRPLSGARVWVRPHTEDRYALRDTFLGRFHVPPLPAGDPSVRRIWDLGSNIGMTVAHFAVLFPEARIRGVELDAENAALCRRNVATWSDRCEILRAAIWTEDGTIRYERQVGNELGFRVRPGAEDDRLLTAPSISLNTLAERDDGDAPIDLVKMDIEGAERDVLRQNTEWAALVRTILVEIHEPYDVSACCNDLARLGFKVTVNPRHHAAVVGVRH